ncbi:MAG TPA: hypothetical protein PLD10_14175 [Rhodopila sp.]|nr:hypothetical protein [Rhodopila sp.]
MAVDPAVVAAELDPIHRSVLIYLYQMTVQSSAQLSALGLSNFKTFRRLGLIHRKDRYWRLTGKGVKVAELLLLMQKVNKALADETA